MSRSEFEANRQPCRFCRELIVKNAIYCPYCRNKWPSVDLKELIKEIKQNWKQILISRAIGVTIVILVGVLGGWLAYNIIHPQSERDSDAELIKQRIKYFELDKNK